MNVAEFESEPTNKRHPAYESSMLYSTAPEWSTGEVLLASSCRRLLLGLSESAVDLDSIARVPVAMPSSAGGRETWTQLLMGQGGITSPLRHGQASPTAARQLMPLVPSISRIAGVLGKRPRSRWNPSNLLLEAVGAGRGKVEGQLLVVALAQALEVGPSDDVFARFVETSLKQGMAGVPPPPAAIPPYRSLLLQDAQLRAFRTPMTPRHQCPAERFCADLPALLAVKNKLTRRQWTVLLEAMLRLGLGMHVLWICNANIVAWEIVLAVASGNTPPTAAEVEAIVWRTHEESRPLLELGADAEPLIERIIEQYAYARTGLNLLLCRLEETGASWPSTVPIGFATSPSMDAPAALATFFSHVYTHRVEIDTIDGGRWLRERVGKLFDDGGEIGKALRDLAQCGPGYTKNLFEFARHSLGQVRAKDPDQRCYDLSYLLAYADDRKPLPVHPGPAMLVALVHACCATNPAFPVSLDDFRSQLAEYGLRVPAGELIHGKTGRDLTMLGLVVDSPDAAGGRLLVRPF